MTRLRQKKPGKDVGGCGEEVEMKTQELEKDDGGAEREMKKLEKRKDPGAKVGVWRRRIGHPYTILILMSLLFCLLQIFFGSAMMSNTIMDIEGEDSKPQQDPVCLLSEDAASAVKRSTTESCSRQIKKIDCLAQKGLLYPSRLESLCPLAVENERVGHRLGCFKDSFKKRLLQGSVTADKANNSPAKCIRSCTDSGYSFAGVQYGVECFCGNGEPPAPAKIADKSCSQPCPGDANENCGGYLTMEIYQTGVAHVSPPKQVVVDPHAEPLGVVFLLTVNGRALSQVVRLIGVLNGPGSFFYIHVDARQDYLDRELRRLTKDMDNVIVAHQRFSTIWGGASLLTMLLSCINHLLSIRQWDWQFVLNLSESDYPIKPRKELFEFLASNKDKNFVKSHGRDPAQFIKKQGLERTFHQCDNRMWRLGSRTLPLGIQFDGGSDWICLNREFSEYIVNTTDSVVTGLKQLYANTLLPAESFFHTALLNTRFCRSYVNNNLHLTNWKRKQGCKCQHKAVVDWCGCSPNDLLRTDWPKITGTRSKQLFFARKFEGIVDSSLFGDVDAWLGLTPGPGWPVSTQSFWLNAFHHKDSGPIQSWEFGLLTNFLAQSFLDSQVENEEFSRVLEVNIYKHRDKIEGFILSLQTFAADNPGTFEVKVDFISGDENMKDDVGLGRLVDLSAGTQADPKELIFRNYLRVFGQQSEMSARCVVKAGQTNTTLELGWVDPLGRLRATSTLRLNSTGVTEIVEANLERPLVPGVWTVAATKDRDTLLRRHSFLVLPSESWTEPADPLDQGKGSEEQQRAAAAAAKEERLAALRSGQPFQDWLARHVPRVFRITDSCSLAWPAPAGTAHCREKTWSTTRQNLPSFLVT